MGTRSEEIKAHAARRKRLQYIMAPLLVVVLAGGWFFLPLGFFIPACMLLGIGIGAAQGRKWCDWMCPRGSFFDRIVGPISRSKRIPPVLRSMPVKIAMLTILMAMVGFQTARLWPDAMAIAQFFLIMLTVTTVLGILLGNAMHQRAWCSFCPVGTMAGWAGHSRKPLSISQECIDCKRCEKVCPMTLAPYTHKESGIVRESTCVKCGNCVAECPVNALSFPK